jgi:hypothetical protein
LTLDINQYCWNTVHLTLNLNKWVILWQLLQKLVKTAIVSH